MRSRDLFCCLQVSLSPRSRRELTIIRRVRIRLIITTPNGSLVDVLGRMFAEDLGARLGQSLIVDNRPGGMTQIGVQALNRAPPDGYTLMIGTSESTMLPFLKKSYRYDPIKDFTPVALLATSWTAFAINPKVPRPRLRSLLFIQGAIPAACAMGPAVSAARFISQSKCFG